ncbi:ABC transporter ATP-binding protein [Aeribacillus composti]|uniref:ABC transporter ATP-binding protein n=1 Tax=Aeribacillus composti TaxID=1868734 RepID=UPI003D1D1096
MGKKQASSHRRSSPWTQLKPFWTKKKAFLFASVAAHVTATLMGLVPYWVIYRVCDGLLDQDLLEDGWELLTLAGIALVSIVIKGGLTALATNWTHEAAYHIVYEVRLALADKLARLPLGFFERNQSGKLKHIVNEDVEQLEEGIAHLIPDITTSAALPLMSFALMFAVDWRLALAALGMIVLTAGSYSLVIRKLQPIQAGFAQAGPVLSQAILSYVYGMKVIRAFSRTESAYEQYAQAVQQFSDVSSDIEARSLPYKSTVVLLSRTALLIVTAAGLWLLFRQQLTAATLVLFVLMSVGVGGALFKLLRSGGMTAFRLGAAMKNISQLLAEPAMSAERVRPAPIPKEPSVQLDNVSFAYREKPVLRNISLHIPAGSFTAIVGPSGAGKTTVARLISRFWDVTEGSVCIGGIDVREMDEEQLLSMVSFVFQDAYLFSGTVMDNIRIGRPDATDEEVIEAAKRAACHEFITALPQGYQTEVGEGGFALSGGERQRISLVRAVLKDAPILILDEATALVDPDNESRIQDAILALTRADNGKPKTIIAIAHRLGTIVHADQVVVLNEGQIAAIGRHEQLLANHPLYQNMWKSYIAGSEQLAANESQLGAPQSASVQRSSADRASPAREAVDYAAHQDSRLNLTVIDDEVNRQAEDDPFRRLKQMTVYEQTLLLACKKQRSIKAAFWLSALENSFTALGYIALVVTLYAAFANNENLAWAGYGAMALAFIGHGYFYYASSKRSFPLFGHFLLRLRLYLGRRLTKLPYSFFMQKEASVIESRIKSDASTYIFMPSTFVLGLIKIWSIPPLLLIGLFVIDWRLAIVSLIGVPISLLALSRSERKLQRVMLRLEEARRKANGRILEYIRGITVIRAYGLTGRRMRSYEQAIAEYRQASIAINRDLTPYTAIYAIAFELGLAIVLVIGGYWTMQGELLPALFIVFLVLAICFYEPLPLMEYAMFRRLLLMTIDNLNDIIQQDDLTYMPHNGQEQQGHQIEFRQVRFGYGDRPILQHFDLVIPQRGTTALVGPSGAGKTTILNLIARFWDVQEGAITVGGRDIRSIPEPEWMRQLAFVFQDVYLFNDTIANNIKYGNPNADMEQIVAAARKARCHDFIMQLSDGYDTLVGEGGNLLSGGQKQRIAIARAILKDAPIILLDEATSSVDPDNERYIIEAMEELARDKTVVTIAHRLHTVRNADKIVVIDRGQVVQQGTHAELLEQGGLYRHFWEERSRAKEWVLPGRTAMHESASAQHGIGEHERDVD